jgi:predicted ATPase/class 3 adenylate cyclase/Flp pilus assembly protein TadD
MPLGSPVTPEPFVEPQPRHAAILLTDVVDSTEWHRTVGDETARRAWAAHDAQARHLLKVWRGQEIGRTDGFLILFELCDDALGFAWAYHEALAMLEHRLAARVGIHWGAVILRPNRPEDVASGAVPFDVDGLALPAAARVMSVAQGGQTLLSADALQALGLAYETVREIRAHGHWRLKGLDEPIELFDVAPLGRCGEPPPDGSKAYRVVERDGQWVPARDLPNNLGRDLSHFVGRTMELRRLAQVYEDGSRLVNLIGIGGIGKTRLSRQYARAWLGSFPGGAWFCDLSTARTVDGIALAVAQALDVPLGGADPVQQLGEVLRGRGDCLLLLDNFEQVARFASATVGAWLAAAPGLRALVTSREVLGLPGEQVQVLAPLGADEAVDLYLRCLNDAGHAAPLGGADREALPTLVEMLDRLPLAIELSAARARSVGPGEQLRRIGERFRLLAVRGGRHDRQATIRSTLDWSWDLLDDAERALLAQLSVFDGGFTLEAAEAVCELPASQADAWMADVLQSLVEKSLLRRPSLQRFDLLRTVQDYGLERLGADEGAVRLRHARHFACRPDSTLLSERGAELDNLVSACRWATAESAHDVAQRSETESLAVALLLHAWTVLRLTGPFRAAMDLAQPLHERTTLLPLAAARVCRVRGAALGLLGRSADARAAYELGLHWAGVAGEVSLRAHLQCLLADQEILSGRLDEADNLLRQARDSGARDEQLAMVLANTEGLAAFARSDLEKAEQHFERALELSLRQGDPRWEGGIHGNLGRLAIVSGRSEAARTHLAEALRCAADLGDRQWEGNARCNLGYLLFEQGELVESSQHLTGALELARMLGHRWLEATVLCNLGLVTGAQGAHATAVELLERAVLCAHHLGARATEGQFGGYLAVALAASGQHDRSLAAFERALALLPEGAAHAHDRALLLSQRARVLAAAGWAEPASEDLNAALALTAQVSASSLSELGRSIEAARAALS